MGESNGKRDAKSLVSSILAGTTSKPDVTPDPAETKAPTAETETSEPTADDATEDSSAGDEPDDLSGDDAEATDLINVYFELEEPQERDAAFDLIVALHSPIVENFLRAVMQEDEDEYVRAAAAAALTRRGDVEAVAVLAADLDDPEEPYFFEHMQDVAAQERLLNFPSSPA